MVVYRVTGLRLGRTEDRRVVELSLVEETPEADTLDVRGSFYIEGTESALQAAFDALNLSDILGDRYRVSSISFTAVA